MASKKLTLNSCEKLNFYEILNIGLNASQAEIKKGYKVMALQVHPDKNKNDTDAGFKPY